MRKEMKILFLFWGVLLLNCTGVKTLDIGKILEYSGRTQLPNEQQYVDDGAVILYEDIKTQLFFDGSFSLNKEKTHHVIFRYFNEKADEMLSQVIYLDDNSKLLNFYARTIRDDGTIINLTKEDLFPTQIKEDFVELSTNKSMKFTFPGVEPGVVMEYFYAVKRNALFSLNDKWYIQETVPKLYTRYTLQIPTIFQRNNIKWKYCPVNISLDRPEVIKDIVSQNSIKDDNRQYYWEVKDVPSLKYEPKMPPYSDIAMYAIMYIKFENWDELSEAYWSGIEPCYKNYDTDEINKILDSIIDGSDNCFSKIKKVFYYTQQNYRYIAIDMDDSDIVPNFLADIINRKYGDCKDMTLLNVVLLRALGIEAYPALVKTKEAGCFSKSIVQMNFNHMVAYVIDENGNEYWLDATGNSCPINEVYTSIEGVEALVIRNDGSSFFKKIPASKSSDNAITRNIVMNIEKNGSVTGHTHLLFEGNENLYYRSTFTGATEKDFFRFMESYLNQEVPGIQINNLKHDDFKKIDNQFKVDFEFKLEKYGIKTGNFFSFRMFLLKFTNFSHQFHDEKRKYPIVLKYPYEIFDTVTINFDIFLFTKPVTEILAFSHSS